MFTNTSLTFLCFLDLPIPSPKSSMRAWSGWEKALGTHGYIFPLGSRVAFVVHYGYETMLLGQFYFFHITKTSVFLSYMFRLFRNLKAGPIKEFIPLDSTKAHHSICESGVREMPRSSAWSTWTTLWPASPSAGNQDVQKVPWNHGEKATPIRMTTI